MWTSVNWAGAQLGIARNLVGTVSNPTFIFLHHRSSAVMFAVAILSLPGSPALTRKPQFGPRKNPAGSVYWSDSWFMGLKFASPGGTYNYVP